MSNYKYTVLSQVPDCNPDTEEMTILSSVEMGPLRRLSLSDTKNEVLTERDANNADVLTFEQEQEFSLLVQESRAVLAEIAGSERKLDFHYPLERKISLSSNFDLDGDLLDHKHASREAKYGPKVGVGPPRRLVRSGSVPNFAPLREQVPLLVSNAIDSKSKQLILSSKQKIDDEKKRVLELQNIVNEAYEQSEKEKHSISTDYNNADFIRYNSERINFSYSFEDGDYKEVFHVEGVIKIESLDDIDDKRIDMHKRVELKHSNPLLQKVRISQCRQKIWVKTPWTWQEIVTLILFTWVYLLRLFLKWQKWLWLPEYVLLRKPRDKYVSLEILAQMLAPNNMNLSLSTNDIMDRLTISASLIANVNVNRFGDTKVLDNTKLLAYHYSNYMKLDSAATFPVPPIRDTSSSMDIVLQKSMFQGWGPFNAVLNLDEESMPDSIAPPLYVLVWVYIVKGFLTLCAILMIFLLLWLELRSVLDVWLPYLLEVLKWIISTTSGEVGKVMGLSESTVVGSALKEYVPSPGIGVRRLLSRLRLIQTPLLDPG